MSKDGKHHDPVARAGVARANGPEGLVCNSAKDDAAHYRKEAEEWKDKALRAFAEASNAKRRAEIDAKSVIERNISCFALDMLPLADNLALAVKSMEGKADEVALSGLRSILEQFTGALAKNGITRLKCVGKKLNPAEHRAVTQIASDKLEDGVVAEELLAGYKIGDRVIREAVVAVAKKPAS